MKAVIVSKFGGPEALQYTEAEKPTPSPNQVVIRVAATGVNYADIKSRYGNYRNAKQPPYIPGLDAAGIIVETGTEVRDFKIGQRVIAFPATGSYADYVVADQILTFPLPDSVDFELGAGCPIVGFTSFQLLSNVARIEKGESVLIHGAAGGIGTTAIQIAKLLGASQVIGTVSSDTKASLALKAGADFVINHTRENVQQEVLHVTKGKGVDIVLDSISGNATKQSLGCLAMFGRLVLFGDMGGEAHISTNDLYTKCHSVLGYSFGNTRKYRPHLVKATADKVLGYLQDGSLQIVIGHKFPLANAAAAHQLVEDRNSLGKILLIPEPKTD